VRALVQTIDPGLARTILRHFLERIDGPVEALNELLPILDSVLSEVNSPGTSAEVDGSRLAAELSRMVSDVTSLPTASTRSRAVSDWARMHVGRQQVAVACGSAAMADLLASNLEEDLGSHRVARLTDTMTDSDRAREVERYVGDEHRQCTVLVFDRSAEEGLNLQSARKILHYELGLSVNRIEQRLGRFDRWSDKVMDPVESVVFIESDAATERQLGAWRRLIDDAFGVFDRSTATLQHVLPGFEDEFLTAVFEDGAAATTLNLHTTAEEVERHRRRITHQDQLDSIDETIEDSDLMEAIGCVDSDPDAILAALRTYAVDALQLDIAGVGAPKSGVGGRQVEPLLPRSEASRIVEGILAVGRRRVEYTSRRTHSIRESRPLLRVGEPLVDRLINFAELDDRGRTFISEVPIKRLAPGTPPTFLLLHDVRVQPDPTELSDSQEELRSSVNSLALRFFPVRIERVLALHGHEAADPAALRQFLSLADVNLASRPERLNELLRGVNWESMCDRGAISAFETVRERLESSEVMREAMSMFDDFVTRDRAIRSSRQRWSLGLEVRDEAVYDRVRAAIESPQVFLDSCGVLILTPEDR